MEMFLLRGFEFAHEEVWDWEERFAQLRLSTSAANAKGKCRRWYIDETCVNVKAKWCYLYRAIDRNAIWRLDAEHWLCALVPSVLKHLGIPEFAAFGAGMREAWSNGQVEGPHRRCNIFCVNCLVA